ncbi:hypothetical protein VHUM_03230 [Vanrija humicola]|uniref:F-box domain-containing protein n=1 Tax=Vanrija humicola TaxID=5417 RepID=A0A7D8V0G4_VANHU|nr:hypothetical protein VHUM_03230 [Vanrija humicola]
MSTSGREAAAARLARPASTTGDANTNTEHTTTGTTLADLPPELLDHILAQVPPRERQRAALALAQVLRGHAPATAHVWAHLPVGSARQVMPLWRRLMVEQGKARGGGAAVVKTFGMESWRGDADILNNALRCLPYLDTLLVNVGTNFAPEHLQEMFERPRPQMQRMEMRFRPYVEQASYYQFLKGSYFDAAVETLYKNWPETPSFTHISLVQDLPPRVTAPPTRAHSPAPSLANSFADLRLVSRFPTAAPSAATSVAPSAAASVVPSVAGSAAGSVPPSIAASVTSAAATPDGSDTESGNSGSEESTTPPTSLSEADDSLESKGFTRKGPFPYLSERLQHLKPKTFAQPIVFFDIKCMARFGAAPVAKHLTHLRLRVPSRDLALVLVSPPPNTRLFPSLRYLDLSTSNVRLDAVFVTLLRQYERLEHLVLDRVNLFAFSARERGNDMCKELGQACVGAGLARGKERERLIAAWDTAQRTRVAQQEIALRQAAARRASADESDAEAMREEMQRQIALSRSRRNRPAPAAHSTFSLRDRPSRRGAAAASTGPAVSAADLPPQDKAYFVLPPLPTMKTICIGGEAPLISTFKVSHWEDEFHSGWRDGLAKLHGWAVHIADKYERAVKKANEWKASEVKTPTPKGGKGKGKAAPVTKVRPPTDIRLFRFARPDEPLPDWDPRDPTVGLIEVEVSDAAPRAYLDEYKHAIADAELYTHSQAVRPPCVLCTVPGCDGPSRRGEEPGERVDGRGGMMGKHKDGCGHSIGDATWGWEGVAA